MNLNSLPLVAITLLLLSACSEEPVSPELPVAVPDPVVDIVEEAPTPTRTSTGSLALPPPVLPLVSGDDRSVRELMNDVMEINARLVWNAVSYTVTAEGTTENFPDTDQEWNALLEATMAIRNGGEALMDQNRPVDPGYDENAWPDWQYTPVEIEFMRLENLDEWRLFLVNMQSTLNSIIDTINRRDVSGYTELGVTLNQACQSCHGAFWYKPLTP